MNTQTLFSDFQKRKAALDKEFDQLCYNNPEDNFTCAVWVL